MKSLSEAKTGQFRIVLPTYLQDEETLKVRARKERRGFMVCKIYKVSYFCQILPWNQDDNFAEDVITSVVYWKGWIRADEEDIEW